MPFVSQMTADQQIYRFVAGDAESFHLPEGHRTILRLLARLVADELDRELAERERLRLLRHLIAAIRAEHERWDGSGYPDGLAGEAIPRPAGCAWPATPTTR
jgi:hypothetical protein